MSDTDTGAPAPDDTAPEASSPEPLSPLAPEASTAKASPAASRRVQATPGVVRYQGRHAFVIGTTEHDLAAPGADPDVRPTVSLALLPDHGRHLSHVDIVHAVPEADLETDES
jgi:hypothetical protein